VFEGVGDNVRHIANPTRPVGGFQQGIGDAFFGNSAKVTL
jgi:hypothetical protein